MTNLQTSKTNDFDLGVSYVVYLLGEALRKSSEPEQFTEEVIKIMKENGYEGNG